MAGQPVRIIVPAVHPDPFIALFHRISTSALYLSCSRAGFLNFHESARLAVGGDVFLCCLAHLGGQGCTLLGSPSVVHALTIAVWALCAASPCEPGVRHADR